MSKLDKLKASIDKAERKFLKKVLKKQKALKRLKDTKNTNKDTKKTNKDTKKTNKDTTHDRMEAMFPKKASHWLTKRGEWEALLLNTSSSVEYRSSLKKRRVWAEEEVKASGYGQHVDLAGFIHFYDTDTFECTRFTLQQWESLTEEEKIHKLHYRFSPEEKLLSIKLGSERRAAVREANKLRTRGTHGQYADAEGLIYWNHKHSCFARSMHESVWYGMSREDQNKFTDEYYSPEDEALEHSTRASRECELYNYMKEVREVRVHLDSQIKAEESIELKK